MQPLQRSAPTWTVAAVAILAARQDVAAKQPGAVSVTAGYGTPHRCAQAVGRGRGPHEPEPRARRQATP